MQMQYRKRIRCRKDIDISFLNIYFRRARAMVLVYSLLSDKSEIIGHIRDERTYRAAPMDCETKSKLNRKTAWYLGMSAPNKQLI